MTSTAQLESRLPCAVVRIWWIDAAGKRVELEPSPESTLPKPPGVHQVGAGRYAVVPGAGDPAIFDSATGWARQLELEALAARPAAEPGLAPLVVIYPGVISIAGDSAELDPDGLDRDLETERPKAEPGIYLSGRAAKMLEYLPELSPPITYHGHSGKALPLLRFNGPLYDELPWRNPEVLGQRTEFVERPALAESLEVLMRETVARISGPLGCGKTRLAWQQIARRKSHRLWLRARPPRIESPILSEQIITQLLTPSASQEADPYHPALEADIDRQVIREALDKHGGRRSEAEIRLLDERGMMALDHLGRSSDRQIWLVVDDFHQISPSDFAFVKHLLSECDLSVFRIMLIGRNGSAWPESLEAFPQLEIPSFEEKEMDEFATGLTSGLSIPDKVRNRFVEATLGYPFAFEEGLFALVHERHLRSIYGSFFFGGDESIEYQPSSRLVRHVEAEVSRLGDPFPLRLLSVIEHPAPAAELASTASLLGLTVEPGWEEPFVDARILDYVASSWGKAVQIISPVNRRALSHSLPQDKAVEARRALGELLSVGGTDGESHWRSYGLLAGQPEAIEPLLALFKTSYAQELPPEELMQALNRELSGVRERRAAAESAQAAEEEDDDDEPSAAVHAEDEAENELLWRLLPLARRAGRLAEHEADLARGLKLSVSQPKRLLGIASIKAEHDQEMGRFQDAENTIQFALKGAGGLEARHKALLLVQLGRLFVRQNRFDEAAQLFTNLHNALDRDEQPAMVATCQFFLGNVALHRGELKEAHRHHLDGLEQREKHGLAKAAGTSLSALGAVSTALGHYPQALDYYRRALELLREHGRESDQSFALLGLARAFSRIGDYNAATKPARRALELRAGRGDAAGEAIARLAVAMNYLDLGATESALEEARKAHFQLTMSSAEEQLAETEMTLGMIHLRQRRYDDARRRFEEALARFRTLDKANEAIFVLAYLVEVSVAQEDADAIRTFTTELKNKLKKLPPPDLGEILDFRIYRGLEWLSGNGYKVGNPASFLARAYQSVIAKAENLSQDLRQRYLFQIPANQEIVDTATRLGLTAGETGSS